MGQAVAVVTDSTADLPVWRARELGIHVVPLIVRIDGREYADGVELTPADFYAKLRAARAIPTTSQPSAAAFKALYESLKAADIVSVHISSRLSGTVNSARAAAEQLPHKRIRVIDSLMVSLSLGYLAEAAAQAAQSGQGLDGVAARVEELVPRASFYALLETLQHAHRSGRIGFAQALAASVLQVKPILTIREGAVQPADRPRTMRRGIERLQELTLAEAPFTYLAVLHADNEPLARELAERLQPHAPGPVDVVCTGGVIGTHCGPGAVASCFIRA
jgi:DegV family protein with EDD domain